MTELRKELLKAAQDNFDEGDYIIDSQDWRRFFDKAEAIINQQLLLQLEQLKEGAVIVRLVDDSVYTEFGAVPIEVINRAIEGRKGLK